MKKQNFIIITLSLFLTVTVFTLIWIFSHYTLIPKVISNDEQTSATTTPEVAMPEVVKNIEFNSQTFSTSTPSSTVSIFYPFLNSAPVDAIKEDFNSSIKTITDKFYLDFKKNEENEIALAGVSSSLMVAYDIKEQNQDFYSVLFSAEEYITGSAHPSHPYVSLNYDLVNGKEIKLADLFKTNEKYLEFLSAYTAKELQARNEKTKFTDTGFIKTGTAPKEENFSVFNITKTGLEIIFPEYQVAPYVSGQQTILIPWSAFDKMLDLNGPVKVFFNK